MHNDLNMRLLFRITENDCDKLDGFRNDASRAVAGLWLWVNWMCTGPPDWSEFDDILLVYTSFFDDDDDDEFQDFFILYSNKSARIFVGKKSLKFRKQIFSLILIIK